MDGLWIALGAEQGRWLQLASLFFLLGVLVWLFHLYQRVERPEGYPAFAQAWQGWASVGLGAVALGLYGAGFLLTPALHGVGYLFLLAATVIGAALARRALPPLGYYLPLLIAGFTFLLT